MKAVGKRASQPPEYDQRTQLLVGTGSSRNRLRNHGRCRASCPHRLATTGSEMHVALPDPNDAASDPTPDAPEPPLSQPVHRGCDTSPATPYHHGPTVLRIYSDRGAW